MNTHERTENTRVHIIALPKTALGWFLIRLPHFCKRVHAVLIPTGTRGDAKQKATASPRCCYPSIFIGMTIVWRWWLVRSEEVATPAEELIVFALKREAGEVISRASRPYRYIHLDRF